MLEMRLLTAPLTATQRRNSPGIVTKGKNYCFLPFVMEGGNWFRGNRTLAKMPKNIAPTLENKEFKNFDKFRQTFWQQVAENKILSSYFVEKDILRMNEGKGPLAPVSQHLGHNYWRARSEKPILLPNSTAVLLDGEEIETQAYHLHHMQPISEGGEVYELSNIVIVSPKYHFEFLHNWGNRS